MAERLWIQHDVESIAVERFLHDAHLQLERAYDLGSEPVIEVWESLVGGLVALRSPEARAATEAAVADPAAPGGPEPVDGAGEGPG